MGGLISHEDGRLWDDTRIKRKKRQGRIRCIVRIVQVRIASGDDGYCAEEEIL
jgi:hypothetical protein